MNELLVDGLAKLGERGLVVPESMKNQRSLIRKTSGRQRREGGFGFSGAVDPSQHVPPKRQWMRMRELLLGCDGGQRLLVTAESKQRFGAKELGGPERGIEIVHNRIEMPQRLIVPARVAQKQSFQRARLRPLVGQLASAPYFPQRIVRAIDVRVHVPKEQMRVGMILVDTQRLLQQPFSFCVIPFVPECHRPLCRDRFSIGGVEFERAPCSPQHFRKRLPRIRAASDRHPLMR